jgi:hypothetical protein
MKGGLRDNVFGMLRSLCGVIGVRIKNSTPDV